MKCTKDKHFAGGCIGLCRKKDMYFPNDKKETTDYKITQITAMWLDCMDYYTIMEYAIDSYKQWLENQDEQFIDDMYQHFVQKNLNNPQEQQKL